jgi:hypothetical protein
MNDIKLMSNRAIYAGQWNMERNDGVGVREKNIELWWWNLLGNGHLEDLEEDARITLTWILRSKLWYEYCT